MSKQKKVLKIVGLAILMIGAITSLGAVISISFFSMDPNTRNMAVEAEFVGWLLMFAGPGIVLSPTVVGHQSRSWLSVSSFLMLFAGVFIGLGVLAFPKLVQISPRDLEMLYNSILPFAFWISIFGLSMLVWTLERKIGALPPNRAVRNLTKHESSHEHLN